MSTDYLLGPPLKLIFLIKNNNSVNKRKKHLNIWFPLVLLSNFLSQWYWYSQQLPRVSIILKLTSGSWYYIFFYLYCWIVHSEQIVYSICFLFVQIQNVVKIWKLKKKLLFIPDYSLENISMFKIQSVTITFNFKNRKSL